MPVADELQKKCNEQYLPLVQEQFPGVFEALLEPCVEVICTRIDDLDFAIDTLKRNYAAQGCDDVDDELERVGRVLDQLQGYAGMEMPVGVVMLYITHGPEEQRMRMAIPVRVALGAAARG